MWVFERSLNLHHSHGERIYTREVLFLHRNSLLGCILTRNSCDFCRSPIFLGAVKILGSYGGLAGGMTTRIIFFFNTGFFEIE